jgi:hypothetical protein
MTSRRTAAVVVGLVLVLSGCSAGGTTPASSGTAPSLDASVTSAAAGPSSAQAQGTQVAAGTLDQNALASQITDTLTSTLGTPVSVVCPAGVVRQQGATSTCTATVDGQPLPIAVTQSDAAGNADFAAEDAILDMATLRSQVASQYGTKKGGTWTARCDPGDKAYVVKAVGDTLRCTFEPSAGGQPRDFTVTVEDLEGKVSWVES